MRPHQPLTPLDPPCAFLLLCRVLYLTSWQVTKQPQKEFGSSVVGKPQEGSKTGPRPLLQCMYFGPDHGALLGPAGLARQLPRQLAMKKKVRTVKHWSAYADTSNMDTDCFKNRTSQTQSKQALQKVIKQKHALAALMLITESSTMAPATWISISIQQVLNNL